MFLDSLNRRIVDSYLHHCQVKGLASKTLRWYRWHLTRYSDWLAGQALILDRAACSAYFGATAGDLAHSSRRNLRACLRAWGSWCASQGIPDPAEHLPRIRAQRHLPDVLSQAELGHLLALLPALPLRTAALLAVLLDTGLRVSELAHLRRLDLDLDRCSLVVRRGKGGKDRAAFYSDPTRDLLARYLATHDLPQVWAGLAEYGHAGPLTASGIRQLLRRTAAAHGFRTLSPHVLRRTCGTELLARGVDLSTIGDQLGHEDIHVTRQHYARLSDPRRRDLVRGASVIGQALGPVAIDWPIRQSD